MTLTKTKGAPVAQACGLQAVGYGTGECADHPVEARERLRETEARVRSGFDLGEGDPVGLVAESVTREPKSDDRVVVRPDGAGVVADRVVTAILDRERAHKAARATTSTTSRGSSCPGVAGDGGRAARRANGDPRSSEGRRFTNLRAASRTARRQMSSVPDRSLNTEGRSTTSDLEGSIAQAG